MLSNNDATANDIDLQDEKRLKDIIKWYDQQIALAAKSKELSELKSAIARARADEAFALVQVARMTAYDPATDPKEEQQQEQAGD